MSYTLMYKETGKDIMYKIWHCSNRPMIIFSHSDGGSIVFADKLFPIKRGTLCYIGAKKFHYTMPENPDSYVRSKIFCSNENFENTLKIIQSNFNNKFGHDNEVCAIVDEDKIEEVENLFDTLNEAINDDQYASAHYTSAFIKLLIYIDKYALRYTPSPKTFFSTAISYINSNLNDKITVDEIAEVCHMSKYYFCRRFKQIVGYTVMEYILNTRLANAKVLLTSTDLAISEISERCGFSGFSYFSRVFKENCGITPNEFRKRGVVLESLTTNKK